MEQAKEQTAEKFDRLIRLAMELDPEVLGEPYDEFIPSEIVDVLKAKNKFETKGRIGKEELQEFNDIYKQLQRRMRSYIEEGIVDPEEMIEKGFLKRSTLDMWE